MCQPRYRSGAPRQFTMALAMPCGKEYFASPFRIYAFQADVLGAVREPPRQVVVMNPKGVSPVLNDFSIQEQTQHSYGQ